MGSPNSVPLVTNWSNQPSNSNNFHGGEFTKVYYRVHNSLSVIRTVSEMSPVQTAASILFYRLVVDKKPLKWKNVKHTAQNCSYVYFSSVMKCKIKLSGG